MDIYSPTLAIMHFAPDTAVHIVSDVRGNAPARVYAIESRIDRVERLVGVKRVWVQVEDVAEERRSASLIRQDDDILRCEFACCLSVCGDLRTSKSATCR